jgi:predicted DNA-binding protein (UPF0251 family)
MTIQIINDTKLLRLVDKKKLTQAAAAKELGVSRQPLWTISAARKIKYRLE